MGAPGHGNRLRDRDVCFLTAVAPHCLVISAAQGGQDLVRVGVSFDVTVLGLVCLERPMIDAFFRHSYVLAYTCDRKELYRRTLLSSRLSTMSSVRSRTISEASMNTADASDCSLSGV